MGLFIAAAITCALVLLVWGTQLWRLTPAPERRFVAAAAALTLPMFFVALWGVRLPFTDPLILRFAALVHPDLPLGALRSTAAYLLPKSLEAPLIEEPAKLWPLLLPLFRARLRDVSPVRVGLALGLGFALSEVAGLAVLLSTYPPYRPLPFWAFGGFIIERLLVALFHATFTTLALRRWGRGFGLGVLAAMAAHWAANFPIILMALGVPPLGPRWPMVITAWLGICFAACAVFVARVVADDPTDARRP
jgi:RsiW-degrading membrane proteinase PrsW (M82 family)